MRQSASITRTGPLIEEIAHAKLPSLYTADGLLMRAFRNREDGIEHLALVRGVPEPGALVRIHSECLTGDALGSLRCDCGDQLRAALRLVGESRSGVVLYIRGHEGRGIGLGNKVAAYELQDQGFDTADANSALGFKVDARDYRVAAEMIEALGLSDIRLLTNNPRKGAALQHYGIRVHADVPLVLPSNPYNAFYLATKRDKMGHRLPNADRGKASHSGAVSGGSSQDSLALPTSTRRNNRTNTRRSLADQVERPRSPELP